jgi:hypothetical protein
VEVPPSAAPTPKANALAPPVAVGLPPSAAPTPKANAPAPPAAVGLHSSAAPKPPKASTSTPLVAVEVPPSAEFTFVASREPTPLPLRPRGFARTLTYLSKSDWPGHARKSSSLARRVHLLSRLDLSLSRVRPTS